MKIFLAFKNKYRKNSTKKMQNKTKFSKIKETTIELCSSTSIHAIPNIFRTKRKRLKVIWAIFFSFPLAFALTWLFKAFLILCNMK